MNTYRSTLMSKPSPVTRRARTNTLSTPFPSVSSPCPETQAAISNGRQHLLLRLAETLVSQPYTKQNSRLVDKAIAAFEQEVQP